MVESITAGLLGWLQLLLLRMLGSRAAKGRRFDVGRWSSTRLHFSWHLLSWIPHCSGNLTGRRRVNRSTSVHWRLRRQFQWLKAFLSRRLAVLVNKVGSTSSRGSRTIAMANGDDVEFIMRV